MLSLKENVNYSRRMVVYAIFDVLDRMDCQYEQAMIGDIRTEANVLGNVSEYAFAVRRKNSWQYVIWQTAYCSISMRYRL